MAVSTLAFYMPGFGPYGQGGAGATLDAYGSNMVPEGMPSWIYGQGTPGAIVPFTSVNKGSLYSEINATDDNSGVWQKVDEGGDAADWVLLGSTGIVMVTSDLYDISAAASEQILFEAVTAAQILEAGLVWEEATGTSGPAEGDFTMGTATGGAQIVAAFTYPLSTAAGAYSALTLVTGDLAAGDSLFASHDQATGAAGTYRLQMKIRVEA